MHLPKCFPFPPWLLVNLSFLFTMSNGDLKTTPGTPDIIGSEESGLELSQWNASAVEADVEPEKYRSRLRIVAVLAGLNVSVRNLPATS
jgi:hypothetical protein